MIVGSRGAIDIGGTFEAVASSDYDYTVWYSSDETLKITGGTITKEGDGYAVYNAGSGTIEYTGGTINGEYHLGE